MIDTEFEERIRMREQSKKQKSVGGIKGKFSPSLMHNPLVAAMSSAYPHGRCRACGRTCEEILDSVHPHICEGKVQK